MRQINCNNWSKLADCIYKKDDLPENNSVVFVYMDDIADFFRECEHKSHKYIVISALSDYGVCYQEHNTVSNDMQKWLKFITISEEYKYQSLSIPARCNLENCKITDKYCVKMHTFTKDTFDKIPDNIVEWYCTNCEIEDPRIIHIPFGIPDWSDDIISNHYIENSNKIDKLYVNFQANTVARGEMKQVLKDIDWCECPSEPMDISLFLPQMNQYKYVLAPCGNGYDCYRTLESIYVGSIPIIEGGVWSRAYNGLPVIIIDSYNELSLDTFKTKRKDMEHLLQKDMTGTRADFDYWISMINLSKENLK